MSSLGLVTEADVVAAVKARFDAAHVSVCRQDEKPSMGQSSGRWLVLSFTWDAEPSAETHWTTVGRRRTLAELLELAQTAEL